MSSVAGSWIRALRIIPRLGKDGFDRLDPVSRWRIASRAAVLPLSFLSVVIGGLLALLYGAFDLLLFILVAAGLLLAHAAITLFNDLFDYRQGVDGNNYFRARYGPQPIVSGLLTEGELLRWELLTASGALAIGT
ncbi:MAG: UbiA family prenyltransferase [Thermoplasmata archaeon]